MAATAPPTTPERPLAIYVAFMTIFSTIFGGAIAAAGRRGRLPHKLPVRDVMLAAVAGHKLARLISSDRVAAPIRAPFVNAEVGDDGDVVEEPAGTGLRRALGELLTCPSCVGQWTCAAFVTGLYYSPEPTRAVASLFAADAVSDFLHIGFRAGKERA
jgi:hypothetical protein